MDYLAGITAEREILELETEEWSKHGQMDDLMMKKLVSNMFDNPVGRENYMLVVKQTVSDMFRDTKVRQQIIAVAEELKKHKSLSGEQVVEIMNQQTA